MNPTVKVKQKADKRVRIIDLSAYDEKLHDIIGDKEVAETPEPNERDLVKAALDEKGVDYAKNASTDKLKEMLEAEAEAEVEAE